MVEIEVFLAPCLRFEAKFYAISQILRYFAKMDLNANLLIPNIATPFLKGSNPINPNHPITFIQQLMQQWIQPAVTPYI